MHSSNDNLRFERLVDGSVTVSLLNNWRLDAEVPELTDLEKELEATPVPTRVTFNTEGLADWDSALLSFVFSLIVLCRKKGIEMDREGLPEGIRRLLTLAFAVPEQKGTATEKRGEPWLARIGGRATDVWRRMLETLRFLGDVTSGCFRLAVGKARFRRSDLLLNIQQCGIEALPIVSLISLLVGLILAFVGAIQLKMFGAQLFVANLVGIAMFRAMGAIMAGIIMAGRTGASFAAQLGSMQVNEEIDALKTSGIAPIDFLVLPRLLALGLMMPLLTLYADIMGILGGLIVGVLGLDLGMREYYNQTKAAVNLTNVGIGIFSGFVFGILVALAGCLRGMQCGRSASAVGDATRSAVVTGIVSIIIATAIITVACYMLGI
ncbi:MAG: putative phospholipid ABC transporter permease protein MlaE [Syntrophorhabdaceae bacterium PtaU1.Bin034]|nr:MAG: putative phospholipid ABC transporter permease protein MlaE [Syntrophorhabdaceae bacterium PtaU1.Bin034]